MDDERGRTPWLPRALVIAASLALACVWLIPGSAANENRAVTAFPDLSRTGLATGRDFRDIDDALVDRLRVKGVVVSAIGDTLIDAGLSPTSRVFRGPSGEPFFSGELMGACLHRARMPGIDAYSRAVVSYFDYYGIDFLWAIAPDKSSVVREEIGPRADLLMACSDANRAQLEAAAAGPDSPLLVAWDELIAEPERVYFYGDLHWNPHGGAVFAELLLDRLGEEGIARPGVFDPSAIERTKLYNPVGGLFFFMGSDRPEPTTLLATRRDGVTTTYSVEAAPNGQLTERWQSTGPGLIPGRTLVLHDSFWFYNKDVIAPYFADVTAVHLLSIGDPGALALIDGYDLVIVQQVQHAVPDYVDVIATSGGPWITAGRPHEEEAPVP
ncbi:MAG: hypothetical protein R2717_03240 [Schumannella sp.]|nr:hypothetical protein [Microbacteriaceae bacterium]